MSPRSPELRRQRLASAEYSSTEIDLKSQRLIVAKADAAQARSSGEKCAACEIHENNYRHVKCVLIGDAAVGKTSLIISYTTDGFPLEYVPTAFDNYSVLVHVNGIPVKVQLCDTAGQVDFDKIRPLCYPGVDLFLICFSIVNPESFKNVSQRWLPELKLHAPNIPFILIGTESDLRTNIKIIVDLKRHNRTPVSVIEATNLAKEIGAISFIECSSLTQQNLKEVFDTAILSALKLPNENNNESKIEVHKTFRYRKSLTKLKNLVSRSNSTDSVKRFRLRRSRSSSQGKLPNAQSIGKLNYLDEKIAPSLTDTKQHHSWQVQLPIALNSRKNSISSLIQKYKNKNCKKTSVSISTHSIPAMKIMKSDDKDIDNLRKGWKKLLCV